MAWRCATTVKKYTLKACGAIYRGPEHTAANTHSGHFNWEEPGMEGVAEWLAEDLKHAVPVLFIQSGNQYRWLSF